jgi:hypothetical protein
VSASTIRWRLGARIRRSTLLLVASTAGYAVASAAPTQDTGEPSACDPDLVVEHASATAYRLRGDRCEGAHSLKISSDTKLVVASLSASLDFSLDSSTSLAIEWSAPPGGNPVHLRSRSLGSLGRGLYYRMDAVVPAATPRFQWSVDVLAALRLAPADIGVVGWTRMPIPGESEERTVYLPLRIGQPEPGPAGADYHLLLVPAERLEEVFLTVTPLAGDGGAVAPTIDTRPLGLGYYPAGSPTWIDLPAPDAPGLLRIDLSARLYRDPEKTISTTLWLYHAEPSR